MCRWWTYEKRFPHAVSSRYAANSHRLHRGGRCFGTGSCSDEWVCTPTVEQFRQGRITTKSDAHGIASPHNRTRQTLWRMAKGCRTTLQIRITKLKPLLYEKWKNMLWSDYWHTSILQFRTG